MAKNIIAANVMEENLEDELVAPLEVALREGARRMLHGALEAEVEQFLEKTRSSNTGRRLALATRNGSMPERTILTGIGPIPVKQPRVNDLKAREFKMEPFTSNLLPPYMRRAPSLDTLLPVLYLKGISTGECGPALAAILGKEESEISPGVICRLKKKWNAEHKIWSKRSLAGKEFVYGWVDGVHFHVRADEDPNLCALVVIGVDTEGNKEFLAIETGYRESKEAWARVLRDLKERGLKGLKLFIGDGALGFWAAQADVFPQVRSQRCWVHKTANILDCLPKCVQPKAKSMLHDMFLAPTRAEATKAYNRFSTEFGDKYPKAVSCLSKDERTLFAFYDFPAEHWVSIRSTNPIESTFATIRLRTYKTRGCCSRETALTMLFKLGCEAEKTWRKLHGFEKVILVAGGKIFEDGRLKEAA